MPISQLTVRVVDASGTVLNTLFGGGSSYTGPGDIVASALGWWGLRAYSAATIGNNCVRIIRASDSTEQDFITLADGSVDAASIATFLAATTGKVTTLYDQSGNGLDLTQSTDALRPALTLSGLGSLPVITFAGGSSTELTNGTGIVKAQPYTITAVAERTGNFAANNSIFADADSSPWLFFGSAGDNVRATAGGGFSAVSASDSAPHAIQVVFSGAASSTNADGTQDTTDLGTDALSTATMHMGQGNGQPLTGFVTELGIWGAAFSAGEITNMSANQSTYWGL